MDNGLIVPYPLACANAESPDTNTTNPLRGFRALVVGGVVGLMG
jgi:hypothetical protein